METIYNWGMYPKTQANLLEENRYANVSQLVTDAETLIARGNGKCYGDSSLQSTIFSSLSLNKVLDFNEAQGVITCQSGMVLDDILSIIVPRGFFLPVTPGTKFITIGGAVASNIHGKNHHKEGSIGEHLMAIKLIDEQGQIIHCSKSENTELFQRTIGGMGLTGIILEVTFQLKPIQTSYIQQKSIKAKNLDEITELFEKYQDYTYSVAWIDCLAKGKHVGKSILMLGEHTTLEQLPQKLQKDPLSIHPTGQINIPFNFPTFTLNQLSVKAFNTLYYAKQFKKEINNITHYNPYFYPLDALSNWNRLYGKNGFTQYQFVLPFEKGKEGMHKILSKIANVGEASFLAVLKTFGNKDSFCAPISFPMPGYTLALDFRVSEKVFKLLNELDQLVIEYGGRLYLTKDARMSREMMQKTYQTPFKHASKFTSIQSERLGI